MVILKSIKSPRYSTKDWSLIDMDIELDNFGVVACSFHADDKQPYLLDGKTTTNGELYARAQDGEFGPVTAYGG